MQARNSRKTLTREQHEALQPSHYGQMGPLARAEEAREHDKLARGALRRCRRLGHPLTKEDTDHMSLVQLERINQEATALLNARLQEEADALDPAQRVAELERLKASRERITNNASWRKA